MSSEKERRPDRGATGHWPVGRRRIVWAGALLLGLIAGGAWLAGGGGPTVALHKDGGFEFSFEGCDAESRCGRFRVLAPGFGYRWNYGEASLQPVEGRSPQLRDVLAPKLKTARMVIAFGLASNEGDEAFNRRLAACRSMRLAELVDDARFDLRGAAPTYRITLGRYEPRPNLLAEDTAIERLLALGFLEKAHPDMVLDQALQSGLRSALPPALDQAPGPIARQLDFTRYSCWRDAFAVTPSAETRTVCFEETAQDRDRLCADF